MGFTSIWIGQAVQGVKWTRVVYHRGWGWGGSQRRRGGHVLPFRGGSSGRLCGEGEGEGEGLGLGV